MTSTTDLFDAVIVAAGSGTRLGFDTPKAFVPMCGKPMLSHSVEVFAAHPLLSRIILVVPAAQVDETERRFTAPNVIVTAGGAERWESVRNGCTLAESPWVLVHDAARPLVTKSVIDSVLDMRSDFKCAFTATPVVDTIRTFRGCTAGETIDRSALVRVGTPQMFQKELLLQAFTQILLLPTLPTDEVMLVQHLGVAAGIATGDPHNFKITTKEDLEIADLLLAKKFFYTTQ